MRRRLVQADLSMHALVDGIASPLAKAFAADTMWLDYWGYALGSPSGYLSLIISTPMATPWSPHRAPWGD